MTKLTLEQFMAGSVRNAYIRFGHLEVYVHRDRRVVDGVVLNVLTRAHTKNLRRQTNMDYNPRAKRTGRYRELDDAMVAAARAAGLDGVFVEGVLNRFLPDVLLRYGYREVKSFDLGLTRNYYKAVGPAE